MELNTIGPAETCCHCKTEIPAGVCQQGQFIDGDWYPLHVDCANAWAIELIPVWTIEYEDYGHTTSSLGQVQGEIAELEEDQEVTVKARKMPRIDFLNLPEGEP